MSNDNRNKKVKTYRSYEEFMNDFRKRNAPKEAPKDKYYQMGMDIARRAWERAEKELEQRNNWML